MFRNHILSDRRYLACSRIRPMAFDRSAGRPHSVGDSATRDAGRWGRTVWRSSGSVGLDGWYADGPTAQIGSMAKCLRASAGGKLLGG